jgi:hypothetical protein
VSTTTMKGSEEASVDDNERGEPHQPSKVERMIVIHRQSSRHHWREIGHERTNGQTQEAKRRADRDPSCSSLSMGNETETQRRRQDLNVQPTA